MSKHLTVTSEQSDGGPVRCDHTCMVEGLISVDGELTVQVGLCAREGVDGGPVGYEDTCMVAGVISVDGEPGGCVHTHPADARGGCADDVVSLPVRPDGVRKRKSENFEKLLANFEKSGPKIDKVWPKITPGGVKNMGSAVGGEKSDQSKLKIWDRGDDMIVRKVARNSIFRKWELLKICKEVIDENDELVSNLSQKEKLKEKLFWSEKEKTKSVEWKARNLRFMNLKERDDK